MALCVPPHLHPAEDVEPLPHLLRVRVRVRVRVSVSVRVRLRVIGFKG